MPHSSNANAEIALDPRKRVFLPDRDEHVVARESARAARRSAASCRRPRSSRCAATFSNTHAGQPAALVRELQRHEVVVDRDALVHRVFLFPRQTPSSRRSPERTTTCTSSPPSRRELRQQSIAVLPPPSTTTRLPIRVVWPNDTDDSQSMPIWMLAAASLRPGMSRSRPRGAPLPMNTASHFSVASRREQLRERIDARATAELDAAVEDVAHLLVDDAIGKPELGNLRAHHAARLRVAVEHDAFVAERREIARDGQRRGTGADQRDALAVVASAAASAAAAGCLPCSRPQRASAGRSRPARASPRPCGARASLPRRGRAGTRARTADRTCAREFPGIRSISS